MYRLKIDLQVSCAGGASRVLHYTPPLCLCVRVLYRMVVLTQFKWCHTMYLCHVNLSDPVFLSLSKCILISGVFLRYNCQHQLILIAFAFRTENINFFM